MKNPNRSIPAAVTLFFLAPLVAEYLLGDFPITFLSPLILMTPFYGGGALLIRELARRAGRGWPTILLLGVAYALIEEGYTTMSLFNPNFLKMHLLIHAWIPALGIGAWWTLFMLNVHPFWSIGVSIALVEGVFPSRAGTSPAPWLGKLGLSITAVLFLAGAFVNAAYMFYHDPFRASHTQFAVTGVFIVLFVVAAFLVPAPATPKPGPALSPWLTAGVAFLFGAAIFLAPFLWNWGSVVWILAVDAVFLILLWASSRFTAWTPLHTLSIGAGGALLYAVHAFIGNPVVPTPKSVALLSHIVCLVLALGVIALAVRRTKAGAPGPSHLGTGETIPSKR